MGLSTAIKAFFKAFKDPEGAQAFLDGKQKAITKQEDAGHLQLLALLQKAGRLVDFFQEDLSACTDAQIGAAARKVQSDCRTVLEELVTVRPVFDDAEGAEVELPVGYDVTSIKVVGNVKGEPPYRGRVVHRGWKAHKRSLPKRIGDALPEVLCQAEIEVR